MLKIILKIIIETLHGFKAKISFKKVLRVIYKKLKNIVRGDF